MNELEALLLGIVQGLTEFLPISSSGHLILVPWLLDFNYLQEHEEFNKSFDVALHAGTLVAVLAYFRADIRDLVASFITSVRRRSIRTNSERVAWLIALATVPAAVIGALGEGFIEDKLGEPWQIAIFLAVFGVALAAADRLPQKFDMTGLNWRSALAIGFAQAAALAPGTSRSGITITVGRAIGLTRDAAARFSFLLLAPITIGAVIVEGLDLVRAGIPEGAAGPMVVGVASAAVSGFLAISFLLRYLRTHNYDLFAVYRLAIAGAIIALIASGIKPATF
jgi:undecaprenyl-diphosphatase